jgi:6-phosphogluconolactonase/glucosamine-6-phosphate isomerase/deaminase
MQIIIFDDAQQVATNTAEWVAELINKKISSGKAMIAGPLSAMCPASAL